METDHCVCPTCKNSWRSDCVLSFQKMFNLSPWPQNRS
uniref:Uncharacterized protein n=1 Tax=Anguilla anguilla TaxID=7936 RepID=A0A0E9UDN4_ANGAN